ncbi:hypothetical protein NliqN6_2077 [Naganishia liquefaciens]|uniref:Cytoplasmic tRNA 2-thiolation protein 2 n=1 Tax=Naganishia liquefaciens TaxID=104408 RepID=A0A8H3YDP4_9TREE|nr:hypothetical protein NliqN6_2077 [Naganishia liquefaciens]
MSCANMPDAAGTPAEEQLLMPRKRRAATGMCVKCKNERGRILRMSVAYCKACFHLQYYARLAKTLHPPLYPEPTVITTTTVPPNGQYPVKQLVGRPPRQAGDVVLALSGGAASASLLDVLVGKGYIGMREDADADADGARLERGQKQSTWRKAWAVHVDFSHIIPEMQDQSAAMADYLETAYPHHAIELVVIRAEEAYDPALVQRLRAYGRGAKDGDAVGGASGEAHAVAVAVDLTQPELPISSGSTTSVVESPLESLTSLLTTLPAASHPHLLTQILTSLLHLAASHLPAITHLLLGETSTRQAQGIIAGAAIGNGWGLPIDLQGVHVLPTAGHGGGGGGGDVTRIKPLREAMFKEAAYYCHIKRIPTVNHRLWDRTVGTLGAGAGPGDKSRIKGVGEARGKGGINSLEKLTEDFITNLGATHPSTVSTISRTGSKLVFRGRQPAEGNAEHIVCPLCGLPAEPSSLEWKARTALTSLGKLPDTGAPSADDDDDVPQTTAHPAHGLAPLLCYACLTAMLPSSTGVVGGVVQSSSAETAAARGGVRLPLWVSDRVSARLGWDTIDRIQEDHEHRDAAGAKRMSMQEMRAAVDDFLINDDEE